MKYRWTLAKHRTLFEKYFRLDEYSISHELFAGGSSPVFTREIFERGVVVAVLPYDPRRGKVVLIEQFRAGAIHDAEGPWLVECVAGVIEDGESEQQVALRECVEEAGCTID
ncbi:MAG: NUDIX domain-containing protein, partial [Gammaproteobacteria bacterium]|nr:NUDIX domain-containing protein [Gammaproteobacteria bacterium]